MMSRSPANATQSSSSKNTIMDSSAATKSSQSFHPLADTWTAYAHLPHDTDWTLASYKTLLKTNSLEEFIAFNEMLPDVVISKCMLFIMKNILQMEA